MDFVIFTGKILHGKVRFLCGEWCIINIGFGIIRVQLTISYYFEKDAARAAPVVQLVSVIYEKVLKLLR